MSRNTFWLPLAGALALAAAGCRNEGPPRIAPTDRAGDTYDRPNAPRPDGDAQASRAQRNDTERQRDAVLGEGRGPAIEPAQETAKRLQRDAKLGDPAGELEKERAEHEREKAASRATEAQSSGTERAQGSDPAAGVKPQKDDEATTRTVVGKLAKASDDEVQVERGDELQLKLAIDPSTAIRVDGREAGAAQLTEGSEVRASYREVDGKLTALRLDVKSGTK